MAGKFLAKKPKKQGGKLLPGILLAAFAAMAVFSAYKLISVRQEYKAGTDVYAALQQSAVTVQPRPEPEEEEQSPVYIPVQPQQPSEAPQPEEAPQQPSEPQPEETELQAPTVDFALLQSINPETVAWITSDDGISYPVVQGTDNEYYLNHLFDGTVNRNGAIFADYRNAPGFADRNTFIYGHNMLNGAMFASLANYGVRGYYEEHPQLILTLPEQTWYLQVFAGYVTPGNSDIYQLSFSSDEEFGSYLQKIRALSDFASDVTVTPQDRIVTLSTCTYDYDDARYVLHCRLTPAP